VWALSSEDGASVGLVNEDRIVQEAERIFSEAGTPAGTTVRLVPKGRPASAASSLFITLPAGALMPDWELALALNGPHPFTAAADRRIATYLWIGAIVVLATILVAATVGRHMGRQVKLTRLKNDLIATVSHELKTPLSSIRALVDTLLARDGEDPARNREYLELIARENARLSRLIDNFLTFSRMERNRHTFEFVGCSPGRIVEAACASVRERFQASGCEFLVQVAPDLPQVNADVDSMVTVLINLLDNAWKYTGPMKCIGLRAYTADGQVCFEVRDNGLGLSRRAMRRVFDRFYQVDQSLSRRAGGCGLGLSIVQFIVKAHGGAIDVQSQPGRGSTFTVKLPSKSAAPVEVGA
jgi:signal transduction histidine kinase